VSSIITVAWAVGADIYIKELDRTYLEYLEKLRIIMKQCYPELSFSTSIHVKNVISNIHLEFEILFSTHSGSSVCHILSRHFWYLSDQVGKREAEENPDRADDYKL
jgi:hypothetical protein